MSCGKNSGRNTAFFSAASMKEMKQQRNSQSIYFVTGGVFERDKEEDAEEGREKKTLQAGLRFQFYIVFFPHLSSVCAPCFILIALRTSAGTSYADSGYLMTLMFYWRAHGSEVE